MEIKRPNCRSRKVSSLVIALLLGIGSESKASQTIVGNQNKLYSYID